MQGKGTLGLVIVWVTASGVQAQGQPALRSFEVARDRLAVEPSAADTLKAALRYFRVDPHNFDRLRKTANQRAYLPTLSAGYRFDDDAFERSEDEMFEPRLFNEDTNRRIHTVSVGGVWDLRDLVFNPSEVQVYGLIGVQRNLMLEVTRIYYLRRQLFVRFLEAPPTDPVAREALLLRIDEFTALLDVLTGGWFTYETARRGARSGRR